MTGVRVDSRGWSGKRAFLAFTLGLAACTTTVRSDAPYAWEPRLRGSAIVLLGEVHDNAEGHRLRLEVLRRAFEAGWRPAIAMEQFDRGRQRDIERARRERPDDAQHVIDAAATPSKMGGGWNWDFYRPVVALALRYDVPLVAANLANADTSKIVKGGIAAAIDSASMAELGLDRPVPADLQAGQESEIDFGHCHALPMAMWPRMANAQFARDAVMADVVRRQGGHGVVLIAGNGHVRRDLGVPRWLAADVRRAFSVGFLEEGDDIVPTAAFDAVVRIPPSERGDPCAAFAIPP
ncbi:MAG: ChaN family lipoprotein [Caldimonas sp.]